MVKAGTGDLVAALVADSMTGSCPSASCTMEVLNLKFNFDVKIQVITGPSGTREARVEDCSVSSCSW
jgi:hypothetical protein